MVESETDMIYHCKSVMSWRLLVVNQTSLCMKYRLVVQCCFIVRCATRCSGENASLWLPSNSLMVCLLYVGEGNNC